MSNLDYKPVECLFVPKVLFKKEEYRNLSTTAKALYSLLLDRLDYAVFNGWVDKQNKRYVLYPKSEMKKDLHSSRYFVDSAIRELEETEEMVRVVRIKGKPNRFYVKDITKCKTEEKTMMTMKEFMDKVKPEDKKAITEKLMETAQEMVEDLVKKGYFKECEEYEAEEVYDPDEEDMDETDLDEADFDNLNIVDYPRYYDENGELDEDAIDEEASEFGMDLAFGVLENFENTPEHMKAVCRYVNRTYKMYSMKKFMAVVETLALVCGNNPMWAEGMYDCDKPARRIYLADLVSTFNMYMDMFKNKELE